MLRNEVVYTLSVRLVRTVELSMMATTAEFDGILIDMKHSTADLDTTSMFPQTQSFLPINVLQAIYAQSYSTLVYTQSCAFPLKIHYLFPANSTAAVCA
jgi:hypothetical protein